jgi:exosortase/archaeosortase family protein
MLNVVKAAEKNISTVIKLLPLFSFIIPFVILYFYQDVAYPPYSYYYYSYTNTFEVMWKGRAFYLFFLWLFLLEMILSWEELRTEKWKLKSIRTVALIIVFLLPTVYVIEANFYGVNKTIVDLAYQNNMRPPDRPPDWMPLSTEYLVFTVLFALIVLLAYDINGLSNFSISIVFLGTIGLLYTIDNLYPNGRFTPFQLLVPTTSKLAANVLNLMGYKTVFLSPSEGMPYLLASNSRGSEWGAYIAWPCSGIDSLLIYTVTILLFLRKSVIPLKQRFTYFIIGAVVTYFVNILRIATIFVIGMNGTYSDVEAFHNTYGQLYSVIWIVSYPLIIIGSRELWGKIKNSRVSPTDTSKLSPQIKPP